MIQDDGMDNKNSKIQSLMDLISEMKQLHGGDMGKPKAVSIEVQSEHALPSDESNEDPREESLESPEEESDEDHQEPEMNIPPELLALLMEHMKK